MNFKLFISLFLTVVSTPTVLSIAQGVERKECFFGSGNQYVGTVNMAANNMTCVKWNDAALFDGKRRIYQMTITENLKNLEKITTADHNYCRVPIVGNHQEPYCYTVLNDMKAVPETCGIPNCEKTYKDIPVKICYNFKGQTYIGTQFTTSKTGIPCTNWDNSTLTLTTAEKNGLINNTKMKDSPVSDNNHNYCRNPDIEKRDKPYCYTMQGIAEDCAVPFCDNVCAENNPCMNNATCSDDALGFFCHCITGFEGEYCEKNIDDCNPNRCQNGGLCKDEIGNYTCECTPGFEGFNCDIDINECASNPCQNGATCLDEPNQFRCQCPLGRTGAKCETDLNECDASPCQNNGECSHNIDSVGDGKYACTCQVGFTGVHCETNIDDCANQSCSGKGSCQDGINNYTCSCVDGYVGQNCERDLCSPSPCKNNGQCKRIKNDYECSSCTAGFVGKNCSSDKNDCDPNPCQNEGNCTDALNNFKCTCKNGFKGDKCQTVTTTTSTSTTTTTMTTVSTTSSPPFSL